MQGRFGFLWCTVMLKTVKVLYGKTRLFDYRTQCAFGDVFTRMVGNDGSSVGGRIIPDFMASFGVPVKEKAGLTQFMNDLVGF